MTPSPQTDQDLAELAQAMFPTLDIPQEHWNQADLDYLASQAEREARKVSETAAMEAQLDVMRRAGL